MVTYTQTNSPGGGIRHGQHIPFSLSVCGLNTLLYLGYWYIIFMIMSKSLHIVWCPLFQVSVGRSQKDGAHWSFSLVDINTLNFLQCFDIISQFPVVSKISLLSLSG